MRSLVDSFLGRMRPSRSTATGAAPIAEESRGRRLAAPAPYLCGITEIGPVREKNEDDFYLSPDRRCWIVADGMGGPPAGEVAAALALQGIAETTPCAAESAPGDPPEVTLRRALGVAQERILHHAALHEECAGMGCAVAVAHVHQDRLHVGHVGDVRCYLWAAGKLDQITSDHSVVEDLLKEGKLTQEEALEHPDRGVLKQALGSSGGIEPDLNTRELSDGDRVLLCSDGIWGSLSGEELAGVLASDGSMRQLATVLVERAVAAGGYDNLTAVLYEHCAAV